MKNAAIKNGLVGGIMGAIMSGLINYYLIPFPKTLLGNAIGNRVGF